jgi:short subunit dehydrogenase-like uncharacterized protein
MSERDFDILLYGATGFVGRQATRYLAERAPANGLRIAIAGRDRQKLEAVKASANGAVAEVLTAEAHDQAALDSIVSRARLVLNTAGPFAVYGDRVVDACVRFRTHYVDITGETPWIRSLIDRYDAKAAADGTRIVPACGFDSVPSDLGAYVVIRYLQHALGVACSEVKAYFVLYGGLNGGTLASLMVLNEDPAQLAQVRDPFLLDPPNGGAKDVAANRDPEQPMYDADIGAWTAPFFMGPVNTRVVRRSAALYARWGEPYGPAFRYQEYLKFAGERGRLKATAMTTVLGLFLASVQLPIVRRLLKPLLPKPGSGPSDKTMSRGFFRCELVGVGEDGRRVRGVLRDTGDPANAVTVKCVCESALGLLLDADALPGAPNRGGILTPASALGDVLERRLRDAGMTIEVGGGPAGPRT